VFEFDSNMKSLMFWPKVEVGKPAMVANLKFMLEEKISEAAKCF